MTEPMPEPMPEPEPTFQVEISPEIEPGVHADFTSIWHTPDTFVLDFASLRQPPFLEEDEAGSEVLVLPTRIVARVKIPPSQVFELMRASSSNSRPGSVRRASRGLRSLTFPERCSPECHAKAFGIRCT
jgi:hypothetical protein